MLAGLSDNSFRFVRYGETYQLRLDTAEDLLALPMLDETFWMATSAPIHQLQSDPKLLSFLDADGDGRILSRDIRRALSWLRERLDDLDGVTTGSDVLQLAHLKAEGPHGEALRVAARRILQNRGRTEGDTISLTEVRDESSFLCDGRYNGDGIIPPEAVEAPELAAFLKDVVATMGGTPDRAGTAGVDTAVLNAFLDSSRKLLSWILQTSADQEEAAGLFPLGAATAAAYELLQRLETPMERYFELCRLSRVHEMLGAAVPPPAPVADAHSTDTDLCEAIAAAPLARPRADGRLELNGVTNPAYTKDLRQLATQILPALLADTWDAVAITRDDWATIRKAFTAYESWLAAKPAGAVEKLGPKTLRRYLDSDLPDRVRRLIARDLEVGAELAATEDLEHLLLLQQWLLTVCRNFVNFHCLYDPEKRALFEVGRMVIGGRTFNLNMPVRDVNAHSAIAKNSGILLLYSEITGPRPEDRFFVVTPVTSMALGRLGVERRGVLFDLDGREWDARVIKVVENPISLWEAVTRPFVRLGAAFIGSFEKFVGGAEKQLQASVTKTVGQLDSGVQAGMTQPLVAHAPNQEAPAARPSNAREWMLSGSVAMAALGSSFAFIAKTVTDIKLQAVLAILVVGLAVILIPTILIADYRLHRRNLGSLLEASGWAINSEMRITRRFARVLAPYPVRPAGFSRIRRDLIGVFDRRQRRPFTSRPEA